MFITDITVENPTMLMTHGNTEKFPDLLGRGSRLDWCRTVSNKLISNEVEPLKGQI